MKPTSVPKLLTNNSKNRSSIVLRGTILLGLTLLLATIAACSPKPKGNELIVGMDLSYPPFETVDQSGKPAGISVELANALAQNLGRKLTIVNIPFTGLIPSLQNGSIDCVISSMTDTPERRKSIGFSDPYLNIGLALLVGKSSPIQSVQDLDQPGKSIVVRQGTTGEVWARENIKRATIHAVAQENYAVLEVTQGKSDAFIYDQMSIWQNAQKNPDTTRALLQPIRQESWAIGTRLDNDALRQQINTFIQTYRAQGGFEKLGDQFLKDQKDAFRKENIPFYF